MIKNYKGFEVRGEKSSYSEEAGYLVPAATRTINKIEIAYKGQVGSDVRLVDRTSLDRNAPQGAYGVVAGTNVYLTRETYDALFALLNELRAELDVVDQPIVAEGFAKTDLRYQFLQSEGFAPDGREARTYEDYCRMIVDDQDCNDFNYGVTD